MCGAWASPLPSSLPRSAGAGGQPGEWPPAPPTIISMSLRTGRTGTVAAPGGGEPAGLPATDVAVTDAAPAVAAVAVAAVAVGAATITDSAVMEAAAVADTTAVAV